MLVGFQEKLASVLVVFNLIASQFSVGFQDFVSLLVFGQVCILLDQLENLLQDFEVFFQDVVKHPLVYPSTSEEAGIL
jgi:hypothetical protein